MKEAAKKIAEEAKRELAGGGFTPAYIPDWSPYYWLGRLKAAEEVMADDGVRRRNGKRSSDRPAR